MDLPKIKATSKTLQPHDVFFATSNDGFGKYICVEVNDSGYVIKSYNKDKGYIFMSKEHIQIDASFAIAHNEMELAQINFKRELWASLPATIGILLAGIVFFTCYLNIFGLHKLN
jgi:hypothetical protein